VTRIVRPLTLIAAMIIATSGLAACGSSAPNAGSSEGSVGPGGSGGPSATGLITNLPDLGLGNVTTERGAARAAMVGPDGGTIVATGSNGAEYTLAIPPGALSDSMEIGLYPVTKVTGLAKDASLLAAVQFSPDGVHLTLPATLSIDLPAAITGKVVSGLEWDGDAANVHLYPAIADGTRITLKTLHFTGAGIGNGFGLPVGSTGCSTIEDMEGLLTSDHAASVNRATYTRDLKTCYEQFVKPTIADAELYASQHDRALHPNAEMWDADVEDQAIDAYNAWLLDIEAVGAWVTDVGYTVTPEVPESKTRAGGFLRFWFNAMNDLCTAGGDPANLVDEQIDVRLADLAIYKHYRLAQAWGVSTSQNQLDLETLLNRLCMQIVIDPSRGYSGEKPGESGTVTIPVGYKIDNGTMRHDFGINVSIKLSDGGSKTTKAADSSGLAAFDLDWPKGVDPIRIDVYANLDLPGSLVARFDRITRASGKSIQMTTPTGVWSTERWPLVMPICRELFVSVDDSKDWTFSLSGPATETRTDGEDIWFRGTGDGVVAFTASSPTHGAGTYSAYLSVLAGLFRDAAATTFVYVDGHLDQEGALSYDVRQIAGSLQTGDWTNITAKANQLAATDQLGNAIDLTLSGDQLAGTIGGDAVTLQRDCG
jgi:hypothetical protein